jgi:hypothetical protein
MTTFGRFAVILTLGLLAAGPLCAIDTAPPFAMPKAYSADIAITTKDGMTFQTKTHVDGSKLRSDMTTQGMTMATIVLKDEKKIYQIMVDQKMAMEMDLTADKFKGRLGAGFGPEGNFQLVGPETVNGVACTKYRVTPDQGKQVYDFWLDTVHKVPVKMAAEDGSLVVVWANYLVGPQDPSLFVVPAGFSIMPMPSMSAPAGADSGSMP